jgi:hypothetical protein
MRRGPGLGLALALATALTLAAGPAAAQARVLKGPWVMDATDVSAAVMIELDARAAVTVSAEAEDGTRVERGASPGDLHEIVLLGLAPSTRYAYAVRLGLGADARTTIAEGSFRTAPPLGTGPVEMLVFGDNRTDDEAHARVVAAMVASGPADLVLGTGDLVTHGSDPEDWAGAFAIEAPLLRSAAFFPTLGNHELALGGLGRDLYERYVRVPRTSGGGESYYAFTWGIARVIVLDSNDDWSVRGAQREWLEGQLADAEDDERLLHRIVVMHHGPFSSGAHGPHEAMLATGVPALLRHRGVDLVLSGHDHDYERGDDGGLKYVVTGGGGAPLYEENRRLPAQLAFAPMHHFLRVRLDGPRIVVAVHRADGSLFERCAFRDGSAWECEPRGGGPPVATGPVIERASLDERPPLHERSALRWWVALLAGLGLAVIAAVWLVRRARAMRKR